MPGSDSSLSIIVKLVDEATAGLEAMASNISNSFGSVTGTLEKNKAALKSTALESGIAFGVLSAGALKAVSDYTTMDAMVQRAGLAVNATSEQLNSFRDVVMQVADQTDSSASEVAVALNSFAGGQISAKEAAEDLGNVMKLKLIANMDDVQQASDLAANSLTVFRDQGLAMTDVLDTISNVQKNVTSETSSYADSLSHAEAAAHSVGFSFQDLNTVLSAMIQGGTQVSDTWAGFNSAMDMTEKGSKQQKDALDSVGQSSRGLKDALQQGAIPYLEYLKSGFDEASKSGNGLFYLQSVLGAQAAPAFASALGQSRESLESLSQGFTDAKGTGEAYAEALIKAQPPLQQLGNKMQSLNDEVGKALTPALIAMVNALKPMIDAFAKFVEAHPKITAAVILITIAVVGLVFILSSLALAWLGITAFFTLAVPIIGAVGAAIAAIGAPILLVIGLFALLAYYVITHWNEIKLGTQVVWDAIKSAVKSAVDYVTGIVQGMFDTVMGIINKITSAISSVGSAASNFGSNVAAGGSLVMHAIVPHFAAGGIVTGPTLGLIGEAGPEAIIPLSQAGGFGNINITITGNSISSQLDVRGIAQAVSAEIVRTLRMNGKYAI